MLRQVLKYFATGENRPITASAADVDVSFKRIRRDVVMIITLAYGLGYVCRLSINVVKKPLIDHGIFSPAELGLIGSVLLYCYAFGKFTNGFLADYANVRRFFAVGLFVSALLNFSMTISESLALAVLFWGMNGWFQSFGAPSSVVALSQWFTDAERGRYFGIWSTAHSIGEGLTYLGIAYLIAAAPKGLGLNWQWGFWAPAIVCVIASLLVLRYLKDRPQTLGLPSVRDWAGRNPAASDSGVKTRRFSTIWEDQKRVFVIPAIWVIAVASASMYVTRYAINSWGNVYLQEIRGFDLFDANLFIAVNTAAGVLGCIAFGYLSDKVFAARRPPANLIFGLLEIAALLVIFYGPNDKLILASALVAYGFGLSGILASLGGLFAIDIAPRKVAGAALGFIGVFSYLGAGIQDYISGLLISGGETQLTFALENGSSTVFFYDYGSAVLFWVGASVLSFFCATSLWRVKGHA